MSRMYLSERQRTELALPVHLLLAVVLARAEVREPPEPGSLKALARIGVAENSDLQRALDLLLPGLERVARRGKVDQSAQKQARGITRQAIA